MCIKGDFLLLKHSIHSVSTEETKETKAFKTECHLSLNGW